MVVRAHRIWGQIVSELGIYSPLFMGGIFAFCLSLSICGFMISAGLGDNPGPRSSHSEMTATGGGVGILAALGGMIIYILSFAPEFFVFSQDVQILALIGLMAMLGGVDDLYDLSSGLKFILFLCLLILAVYVVGPVTRLPFTSIYIPLPLWLGWIGTLLWLFVVVNVVNFMDGANGFMGLFMGIMTAALIYFSLDVGHWGVAVLNIAILAGICGFLPYNFRRKALIFCGDIGSLTIGFVWAISLLILVRDMPNNGLLYIGPILLMPFLTDALLTMARRMRRKEPLLSAHKTHLYQRLITHGWSHQKVSLFYGLGAILSTGICFIAYETGFIRSLFIILLWASVTSMTYLKFHQRLSKADEEGAL